MPGMDGAELLTWSKENTRPQPASSCRAKPRARPFERAIPVVHQYLAKPCDTARLVSILERTERFCTSIKEACLREGVGRFATVRRHRVPARRSSTR